MYILVKYSTSFEESFYYTMKVIYSEKLNINTEINPQKEKEKEKENVLLEGALTAKI